ncbi:MAG: suppressor of fused domain protein [Leptospiraceae bacterium]|nr:suppressor of fused domain protein [Leptospiraceae bacterium]MCK6379934.1 suppressor of fused domain protein [Leptospiraceae bacterium]
MENLDTKIIYQETNPYSSLTAFLEDDNRTVYLYIQSEYNHQFGIKSLWIRNLIDAPKSRIPEDLKSGLAPVLIQDETFFPNAQPSIDKEDIHLIWTEEGDGVALFIKDELYAFLPSTSGINGFHGYSKEAKEKALTASPLGNSENGPIPELINQSRNFWEYRSNKSSWKEIQEKRIQFLENRLGKHTGYWSADGGKYPPLAITKFSPKDYDQIILYSTIGMSAQNMPQVDLYHKDYLNYSRIEIIFAYRFTDSPERADTWVPHLIGELIKFPWNTIKWFGHGHTIEIPKRDPDSLYLNFTTLVIINPNQFKFLNSPPDINGLISENKKQVTFLYLLPITEEEAYTIREKGINSFVEKLHWFHNSERESFI